MDFKEAGNLVYCIGETHEELGGSIYWDTFGLLGHSVPKVNTKRGSEIFLSLAGAVRKGLIRSMHDCSEGGMGVAVSEMAFSGGLGVTVRLKDAVYQGEKKRSDIVLFSEYNSRFIAEVEPRHQKFFERSLRGVPFALIGQVQDTPECMIYGLDQEVCVRISVDYLKQAWQKPLRW